MSVELTNLDPAIHHSLLSDKAILRHMELGTVVIEPFDRQHLSTSSYDVTLGAHYFRETTPEAGNIGVYNPYDEHHVTRVWGEQMKAETHREWSVRSGQRLENIADDDLVIWIRPGETILGHTNEFIGGRSTVTTMMKARSSMGRNFIECCKCAGWGDIGYTNRWTMEITNNSRFYAIPLVVGRRIAQIVFFDTDGTVALEGETQAQTNNQSVNPSTQSNAQSTSYELTGKYQTSNDLEVIKANWRPTDMLPKMFNDRECRAKSN